MLRKSAAMLAFHAGATIGVLTCRKKFDVIVTISTPPLAHVTGACLAGMRKSKHIFWCADVHPETAIRLGLMRRRGVSARILTLLNEWALRKCQAIVAVGSCMRKLLIASGAPSERTYVLPMWQRDDIVSARADGDVAELRSRVGLTGHFVAMYSGNLGRMHHFDTLFEAAKRLGREVSFLMVGSGPGMQVALDFQDRVAGNVQCWPLFPEEQLGTSLSLPDVHIITLRPEMCGVSVPGKLYGAMASGRPVIFIGPGESEVANTIRKENCGFVIAPGDVDGLVCALRDLKADPQLVRTLGANGHRAFHERHCMSRRTAEWVHLIECVRFGAELSRQCQ